MVFKVLQIQQENEIFRCFKRPHSKSFMQSAVLTVLFLVVSSLPEALEAETMVLFPNLPNRHFRF